VVVEDSDGDGIPDKDDACKTTRGVASADAGQNGCPPPPPPPDTDGDGIPDKEDACYDAQGPRRPDPRTNGCPDQDNDGIPDPLDACPFEAGPASPDPKKNGCPEKVVPPPAPDRDHDGIPDDEDNCPDVPGRVTSDLTNGCPAVDPDKDKDGIPNETDACPDDAGPTDPDPQRNGCPKAFLKGTQIRLLDQPKWKPGKPELVAGAENDAIMFAVLKVLEAHPEITLVTIEGHTDNQGKAAWNKELSLNRARVMVKWLDDHGADKTKLKAMGYGPDRPIMPNTTAEGRKANGRMELQVERPAASEQPATPAPAAPAPTSPAPTP
jgi:outer membrane protein OmpA-like peptidoglycan-associated protein